MAITHQELFEDYAKGILFLNTIESWIDGGGDDLDTVQQELEALLGESTARQSPQHSEAQAALAQLYTSNRTSLQGLVSRLQQSLRDKVLRGTMLSYMIEEGTAAITGSGTDETLYALVDNMQADSETCDANGVSAGTVTYDVLDNQGDLDNSDGWAGKVTLDATGSNAQLIRSCTCILEVRTAGYSVQGAETWELRITPTGETESTSPTDFITGSHASGTETEDVRLDSTGQQIPDTETTGLLVTIHNMDVNDTSESGWPATGTPDPRAWTFDDNVSGKSPFRRENVTYAGASGTRNGTVYLRADHTGGGSYTFTLFKESGLTTALSQVETHAATDPDARIDLLVAAAAESLFDGLSTGDVIGSFLADTSALIAHSASFTVTLGVPLPFDVGDLAIFDLTNDGAGVIQTHFARYYGVHLPSDAGGGETVLDSWAE